jgi:hypothetical protein
MIAMKDPFEYTTVTIAGMLLIAAMVFAVTMVVMVLNSLLGG